jgi:hypothetical protein
LALLMLMLMLILMLILILMRVLILMVILMLLLLLLLLHVAAISPVAGMANGVARMGRFEAQAGTSCAESACECEEVAESAQSTAETMCHQEDDSVCITCGVPLEVAVSNSTLAVVGCSGHFGGGGGSGGGVLGNRLVSGSACVCLPGFWGPLCNQVCPGIDAITGEGNVCHGYGQCNVHTGSCDCNAAPCME